MRRRMPLCKKPPGACQSIFPDAAAPARAIVVLTPSPNPAYCAVVSPDPSHDEPRCPFCHTPLDPLRAGAVSIIDGRIVHFCNNACREGHLQRGERTVASSPEPATDDRDLRDTADDIPEGADSERTDDDADTGTSTGMDTDTADTAPAATYRVHPPLPPHLTAPPWPRAHLIESAALFALALLLLFIPQHHYNGYPLLGAAFLALILGVFFAYRRSVPFGFLQVFHTLTSRFPAMLLIAIALWQGNAKPPLLAAVLALLIPALGSGARAFFRRRAHTFWHAREAPPPPPLCHWRDNAKMSIILGFFARYLDWGRLPLALLSGALAWFHSGQTENALLTAALVAIVVDPTLLRAIAKDLHLSLASRAARRGIAVRDGEALDRAGQCRVVLFMAPGTLVQSEVRFGEWRPCPGAAPDESAVISALHAAESAFEDRYARAIIGFTQAKNPAATDIQHAARIPGVGVRCDTAWGALLCATRDGFLDAGISTIALESWAQSHEERGHRVLFVALGGQLAAAFSLEEQLAPGAPEAVHHLETAGLQATLMTSAELAPATAFAQRLRIGEVRFHRGEAQCTDVLAEFHAAGDAVLLLGTGPTFVAHHTDATAAIQLGDPSGGRAGIHAPAVPIRDIARFITDCVNARRNLWFNLTAVLYTLLIGIAVVLDWRHIGAVPFLLLLTTLAHTFCTIHNPFARLQRYGDALRRLIRNGTRRLGWFAD